jgi:hypothetical protein
MAARLLESMPEERALVLMDLGQVLFSEGDIRRATLALRESEALARDAGRYELVAAARHALGKVAVEMGDHESARSFLREAGTALVYDVEADLLATLRDIGNLPRDPYAEQERARRKQGVEDELAALKDELGVL